MNWFVTGYSLKIRKNEFVWHHGLISSHEVLFFI